MKKFILLTFLSFTFNFMWKRFYKIVTCKENPVKGMIELEKMLKKEEV